MTITKTAGAMTQNNSGWEITDTATYVPLGGMIHQQPNGFRDDSLYGYLQNWRVYFQDAGGSGFSRQAELNIDEGQVIDDFEEVDNNPVDGWQTVAESGEKNNGIAAMDVPVDKQYDLYTFKAHMRLQYEGTKASGTNPPLCLAFQSIEEPDNSSTDIFEETGIHSATPSTYEWTPFNANESCNAYTTRRIAGENTTIMNGKSDRGITTPLFGFWQTPPE